MFSANKIRETFLSNDFTSTNKSRQCKLQVIIERKKIQIRAIQESNFPNFTLESAFLKSLNKLSIWSCAIRTCSDASIVILWRFCKRHLSLISNARHLLLISSTKKFIILHIAKNKYIIPIVVALVLFRMSVGIEKDLAKDWSQFF